VTHTQLDPPVELVEVVGSVVEEPESGSAAVPTITCAGEINTIEQHGQAKFSQAEASSKENNSDSFTGILIHLKVYMSREKIIKAHLQEQALVLIY
jgi:hypothetical protein